MGERTKIEGASRYGISYEPVRGEIDLSALLNGFAYPPLDWIIAGGESGAGGAICEADHVRDVGVQISDHDDEHRAALFVKQLGRRCRMTLAEAGDAIYGGARYTPETDRVGVVTFRHAKGGDPAEWPADLRRREMPKWERAA